MIKVVSFDLWNTILSDRDTKNHKEYRYNGLSFIFSKYGYFLDRDKFLKSIDDTWNIFFNHHWLEKGFTPTTRSSMRTFLSYLSIEDYPEEFFDEVVKFMETSFLNREVSFVDNMDRLIKNLSNDYKLALISDTGFTPGKYLRRVLKKVDIFKYFSLFIFSDEIGVAKPDKKVFELLLKYFDCQPGEVVHIGDIPKTDIKGAIDSGIKSILFKKEIYNFKDMEKLKADFETDDPFEIEKIIKNL